MGKYIFYIVMALIIAFTANFFGIVSIPWLDLPIEQEASVIPDRMEQKNQIINKALENS